MTEEFAKPGPRIWLCQSAGAAPPRGWSLRLQSCLSSFGQATEAKPLASGGLQGLAQHTQWQAWGHYV